MKPDFIVVDEIAQWPDTPNARKLWEAASTAMLKIPGARMGRGSFASRGE